MNPKNEPAPELPVRTRRRRPGGRHRSPHSLTLPSSPPALVIGVPAAASAATRQLATALTGEIAELANAESQGLRIHVGYIDGTEERLESVLAALDESPGPTSDIAGVPAAALVPLATGPWPLLDTAVQDAASQASAEVTVAEPLGPHPLLAGVLHQRLAETGLARSERARWLAVNAETDGVIVAAIGGSAGAEAAEASSVLLASRLTVPAAPAVMDGQPGINDAAERLRGGGASQLALVPSLIGPELDPQQLKEAAASVEAELCDPLGADAEVAKLVMLRYGEALDSAVAKAERAEKAQQKEQTEH